MAGSTPKASAKHRASASSRCSLSVPSQSDKQISGRVVPASGPTGGPIAAIQKGDRIRIDAKKRTIDLLIGKAELSRRMKKLPAFEPKVKRGWLARYLLHVTSADKGAVFDI